VFKIALGLVGMLVGIPAGIVSMILVVELWHINWYHGGDLPVWPFILTVALSLLVGVVVGARLDNRRRRRRTSHLP
jgi:hypothetical protein